MSTAFVGKAIIAAVYSFSLSGRSHFLIDRFGGRRGRERREEWKEVREVFSFFSFVCQCGVLFLTEEACPVLFLRFILGIICDLVFKRRI